MPVKAITPDYEAHTQYRDLPSLYHGNTLVYVHWEEHVSFVAAIALPLPPQTPFGAIKDIVADIYGPHPDWAKIDWSKVVWMIDGQKVTPSREVHCGKRRYAQVIDPLLDTRAQWLQRHKKLKGGERMPSCQLTVEPLGQTLDVNEGQTILDALSACSSMSSR